MSNDTRMIISFEVSGSWTEIKTLRNALADERGRWWLRHILAESLEKLLKWATDSDHWRLTIVSGSVGEIRDGKEGDA